MLKAFLTIKEQWDPPRDRVLWAPVFLGCGIGLYFALDKEPAFGATCAALAAVAGAFLLIARRYPAWRYAVFALFIAILGFTAAQARTLTASAPQIERMIAFTRVEGRIVDLSVSDERSDGGKRVQRRVLLDSLVIEKLPPERTPRMVRLSTYHVPEDAVPGERIAVLARLMPPSGPVAPGGFDYRRHAFFDGIGAVGFTMGKFERLTPAKERADVWFNTLRKRIAQVISSQLPHPESAVVTALLAGERASIPDSVNDSLRDSGLYHLLSISGLHVAIVCGVTFFTLRFLMALWPFLTLRAPIKKIAAALALGAGLFYALLAGMPVPTQRAILMTGLVLLAVMLDRTALSMRTIAIAAFLVLLVHPESLVGASFQLSFAAVLAMIAFHEGIGRRIFTDNRAAAPAMRAGLYLGGIAVTTLLVSLATMPPVLHHFGRLQIYGVLANALAIPLTSFVVMPAGMLALLLMPLGLEGPFLIIAGWGVDATLEISDAVAHMPYAALTLPSLPMPVYLVSGFGFLWLCLWRGSWRLAGLALMIAVMPLSLPASRPVVMLDGEGQRMGVHGGSESVYVFKTPGRFVRDNWIALWGGHEFNDGKALKSGLWQSGEVAVNCDDFACRITRHGKNLSILRSKSALFEECNWAGMVVALDKAVRKSDACAAALIPFWDIRAGGGMAFYADSSGWRARAMTPPDKRRPWTLRARTGMITGKGD